MKKNIGIYVFIAAMFLILGYLGGTIVEKSLNKEDNIEQNNKQEENNSQNNNNIVDENNNEDKFYTQTFNIGEICKEVRENDLDKVITIKNFNGRDVEMKISKSPDSYAAWDDICNITIDDLKLITREGNADWNSLTFLDTGYILHIDAFCVGCGTDYYHVASFYNENFEKVKEITGKFYNASNNSYIYQTCYNDDYKLETQKVQTYSLKILENGNIKTELLDEVNAFCHVETR